MNQNRVPWKTKLFKNSLELEIEKTSVKRKTTVVNSTPTRKSLFKSEQRCVGVQHSVQTNRFRGLQIEETAVQSSHLRSLTRLGPKKKNLDRKAKSSSAALSTDPQGSKSRQRSKLQLTSAIVNSTTTRESSLKYETLENPCEPPAQEVRGC